MTRCRYLHKITMFLSLVVLVFAAFLIQANFSYAEEEKTVITVGYDENYGVINDLNSMDSKGFGYDILERSEHYSEFEFEFVEYNHLDAITALNAGDIDVMGIMLESETYAQDFCYVPKPLGSTQLILASKEGSAFYNDPSAIDGKTIASYHGNSYEKYLDEYCEENGISVEYIRDDFDSYVALPADYFLVTTVDANVSDFNMVLNLNVFDMYFVTSKYNVELAMEIADAIEMAISADGTFLEELQIKYYGSKNLTRRYLTQEELALLQKEPLSCGYIDHHQPIQYTDESGEAEGISVQIMNLLADRYGFDVEYFAYNHDMPFESHENFDMLISATGELEHELEFYTPSAPFLELPIMLVAHNDEVDDIVSAEHGSTVGIINYVTIDLEDVNKRYPSNELIIYDRFDELMEAFSVGEVDGFFCTDTGAEYAQAVLGNDEYVIRSTDLVLPLRVFFSNSSPNLTEYLGAFNVMFDHIEQSSTDGIISRQAVDFLPEYSASAFMRENLNIIIIIALLLLILVLGIFFYQKGKKRSAILKIINHDGLTNLMSLFYLTQKAVDILKSAKPGEFEVISVDIDSFHTINSVYSQEKGDRVIVAVANALAAAYRGTGALIARVIADQFVVFCKRDAGLSIKTICENDISAAIKSIMGEKYNISMSVGYYYIDDCDKRIDELIDCAVAARLEGKQKYSFTYYEYNEKIKKEHELKTSIVHKMKDALNSNQFKVFYQPKIRFDTMRMGGAEALVRWFTDGSSGMIPPNAFIGIFESNGFIAELDVYVFERVCKFISENKGVLNVPLISINVSTMTLFDDVFPSHYIEILQKYGLTPSEVELEITESAMALEQDIFREKVQEVKNLGFYMSIDDFGAGESSLNRLSSISAHTLKLDKAFLDYNIAEDRGAIVVETVINMAKTLQMHVVSEGVETLEQAKWLKDLGCDYAQGYYFSRPLSTQDFIELIKVDKTYEL